MSGLRIYASYAMLFVWGGIACCVSIGFAQKEPAGEESPPKQVLALQAFLPEESAEAIETVCLKATAIPDASVAFQRGAAPHVTLSAWRVTADEKAEALERFQEVALDELKPVTISVQLTNRQEGESMSWYLVPREAPRSAIDALRQHAMETLEFEYDDFGGRSRAEWWPHLTLFSLPNARASEARPIVSELEAITEIQLSKLALVGFQSGIQTLSVRTLER